MKEKILTAVSTLMIFVPWTILPLRTFDWALESPAAEIMIACYAGFMIFGGLFTILSYMKARVQNNLMKVCLVIHGLYLAGGIVVIAMMFFSLILPPPVIHYRHKISSCRLLIQQVNCNRTAGKILCKVNAGPSSVLRIVNRKKL